MQVFSLFFRSRIYHCLQTRASHLEKYDNVKDVIEAKALYEKQAEPELFYQDDETDYLYRPPPKTGTYMSSGMIK
jgi:hypothetical protein